MSEEKQNQELENQDEIEVQGTEERQFLQLDDVMVKRDGEGNRLPLDHKTAIGWVKIIPFSYGDAEKYQNEMKNLHDVSTERIAELFAGHINEPDMSHFTAEDVRSLKPNVVQYLLMGIFEVSNMEINVQIKKGNKAELKMKNTEKQSKNEKIKN